MRKLLILSALLLVLSSCKGTDPAVKAAQAEQTKVLVESGNYEITMSWANPMLTNELAQLSNANLLPMDSRGGQINLQGTSNYIKKHGDSLEVYLPYYGTRQMGGAMGTNSAIEFNGIPKDYKLVYKEAKLVSEISFTMDEGTEQYQVNITVWASKQTTVRVNSSHRTSISYTGKVKGLKED
jgi:hypothetical protein